MNLLNKLDSQNHDLFISVGDNLMGKNTFNFDSKSHKYTNIIHPISY